ncbi:MAG: hypothetical protein JWM07_37 [Candidatus Saccharibacteria bacterium]|nr:hypothetical protein [Candidatus Saccharibacteria bacterium]
MNSQQLGSQAQDLQAKAASNRHQAERFTFNAEEYRKNGDETKAAVEDERAQRLIAEADGYESESEQLSQASLLQDARARQIDSEIEQIRSEADSKIAEKEREKERL